MCECISSVWDNGDRNMKLDYTELIDINPFRRDPGFIFQLAKLLKVTIVYMTSWMDQMMAYCE